MEQKEKLIEDVRKFKNCMLVTEAAGTTLTARPMHILEVSQAGHVMMVSGKSSSKIDHISDTSEVVLTFQEPEKLFISLTGHASLSQDREKLKRLWDKELQAWFPNGPDSEEVLLIEVVPQFGEYWDTTGWKKIEYALETTKAYLTGSRPEISTDQHGKVSLQ